MLLLTIVRLGQALLHCNTRGSDVDSQHALAHAHNESSSSPAATDACATSPLLAPLQKHAQASLAEQRTALVEQSRSAREQFQQRAAQMPLPTHADEEYAQAQREPVSGYDLMFASGLEQIAKSGRKPENWDTSLTLVRAFRLAREELHIDTWLTVREFACCYSNNFRCSCRVQLRLRALLLLRAAR